jgi:hypothetical protein
MFIVEVVCVDNICIERIWQDDAMADFYEIKIVAQSKLASAISEVYVTHSELVGLATALIAFPQRNDSEIHWSAPVAFGVDIPLKFYISLKDRRGHVLIEVYMLIDDAISKNRNHAACFYVTTEIGLLNAFGHKLLSIDQQKLGTKISLIDEES